MQQLIYLIEAEVEKLEAHRETLDFEAIEIDRAGAADRARFDPSREATLARRYEAAAEREVYRALREFRRAEAEVVPAPEPEPIPEPPAPIPAEPEEIGFVPRRGPAGPTPAPGRSRARCRRSAGSTARGRTGRCRRVRPASAGPEPPDHAPALSQSDERPPARGRIGPGRPLPPSPPRGEGRGEGSRHDQRLPEPVSRAIGGRPAPHPNPLPGGRGSQKRLPDHPSLQMAGVGASRPGPPGTPTPVDHPRRGLYNLPRSPESSPT